MKTTALLVLFCFFSAKLSWSQSMHSFSLSDSLTEISGLEMIGDSLLVGINDSGNENLIYLLSMEGKIKKKIRIENANNHDWEDLTSDGTYLYIADFGNNANKRTNLVIYKVAITELLSKTLVNAEKIHFKYNEQTAFPPTEKELIYDAEALAFYNDSLWIFTKNRSNPSDGNSYIYHLPKDAGTYSPASSGTVFIGKDGWLVDGLTAVDVDGNEFFFITYNRMLIKKWTGDSFTDEKTIAFTELGQYESVVVKNESVVFFASEKSFLGAQRLVKIEQSK